MQARKNKGSALILVLIALLILSLIGLSALTQTGSEINTTGNFRLDKSAFFAADGGIQNGINEIKLHKPDPTVVKFSYGLDQKNSTFTGLLSGSPSAPENVKAFLGAFKPPKPIGNSIDMGGELGMNNLPWRLVVTAGSASGSKNPVRKQIEALVVTMGADY